MKNPMNQFLPGEFEMIAESSKKLKEQSFKSKRAVEELESTINGHISFYENLIEAGTVSNRDMQSVTSVVQNLKGDLAVIQKMRADLSTLALKGESMHKKAEAVAFGNEQPDPLVQLFEKLKVVGGEQDPSEGLFQEVDELPEKKKVN